MSASLDKAGIKAFNQGMGISVKRKGNLFRSLYVLLGVNLVLCLLTALLQVNSQMRFFSLHSLRLFLSKRTDISWAETKKKGYVSTSGFVLYDLPLPKWAEGFIMPIDGAGIPDEESLLPNAKRGYRNGIHEGVDIFCDYETPAKAAKDGYVLYISDEQQISLIFRNRLLQISGRLFETPPEILKMLHGRQIIIDHGIIDGRWVITVYSHLSGILENLKAEDFVRQGEVIGYVGNSGTSYAGTNNECHLHFEIRANGHYLGEGMTPGEAGKVYQAILKEEIKEPLMLKELAYESSRKTDR